MTAQIFLFLKQGESYPSNVPNSGNNSLSLDESVPADTPLISPNVLFVSLYSI